MWFSSRHVKNMRGGRRPPPYILSVLAGIPYFDVFLTFLMACTENACACRHTLFFFLRFRGSKFGVKIDRKATKNRYRQEGASWHPFWSHLGGSRGGQERPGAAQERPRATQERPKSGQERPKSGPRATRSGPGGVRKGVEKSIEKMFDFKSCKQRIWSSKVRGPEGLGPLK